MNEHGKNEMTDDFARMTDSGFDFSTEIPVAR